MKLNTFKLLQNGEGKKIKIERTKLEKTYTLQIRIEGFN